MDGQWLPYLAAFASGLFGGVHCIGMCGGIVGTLTLGIPSKRRMHFFTQLPFHIAYNSGRILSYIIAGAVMGGIGMLLAGIMPVYVAQRALLAAAGVFMLLLGLYIGGWWRILGVTERLGNGIWKRLEPRARRLLPINNPRGAFIVGAVWGWIPCGLVYAMLANAVAAGSPAGGAGIMLAFGLGTLPNLVGMGLLAGAAAHLARSTIAQRVAGVIIFGFGVWTIWSAI